MPAHDEFLELCAVSISGELTKEEQEKLEQHLESCSSCREALWQFQATAVAVVPHLASETPLPSVPTESSWSPQKTEAALFERIARERQENASSPSSAADRADRRGIAQLPP